MVVAFDFDGTLDDERMQGLAKKFLGLGAKVYVITMRRDNEFADKTLKPIVEKLGIWPWRIIFCDDKPKVEYLEILNVDLYIDNTSREFENILNYTQTIPLFWDSR